MQGDGGCQAEAGVPGVPIMLHVQVNLKTRPMASALLVAPFFLCTLLDFGLDLNACKPAMSLVQTRCLCQLSKSHGQASITVVESPSMLLSACRFKEKEQMSRLWDLGVAWATTSRQPRSLKRQASVLRYANAMYYSPYCCLTANSLLPNRWARLPHACSSNRFLRDPAEDV